MYKDNADYVAMNTRLAAIDVASSDLSPQESTLGEVRKYQHTHLTHIHPTQHT